MSRRGFDSPENSLEKIAGSLERCAVALEEIAGAAHRKEDRLGEALERLADSLDGGDPEKPLQIAYALDAMAHVAVHFEELLGLVGRVAVNLGMKFAPDEFQRGLDLGLAEFIKKKTGGVQ